MSVVTLPRVQIPLTIGGDRVSAEWYRWMHDITLRAGGVVGTSTKELEAALAELANEVDSNQTASNALFARKRPDVVEVQADYLNDLIGRLADMNRRLRELEDRTL